MHWDDNGYGDGYHMDGFMGGFGWYPIILIILIGLVIYAIIKVLGNNQSHHNPSSALDELNRKFVNGDISEEEYKRKKDLIKNK